jgi:BlaI family penicillinase repressor
MAGILPNFPVRRRVCLDGNLFDCESRRDIAYRCHTAQIFSVWLEGALVSRLPAKHPTELELEILKVLWQIEPATVRQVRDALAEFRDLAYTTVMTMLVIMNNKGYVERSKLGRSYVYRSTYREEKASKNILQDVVARLFEGSTIALLEYLLETSDFDDEELKKIRALVNRKVREKAAAS